MPSGAAPRAGSRRPGSAGVDADPVAVGAADVRWWRRQVVGAAVSLRPLPWRRTRRPWPVLVSEIMLQQTQASRVVAPWGAFVERFPEPRSCAAASTAEVVQAWHGLGYNRRAVQLHRAASVMMDEHDGRVPANLVALEALPGVGPYTARAVLAFAYGLDVAVVDTNVRRVISRAICGRPVAPIRLQELADTLLPAGHGWEYNQALVELGAVICTGRSPRCGGCPLAERCRWRASDCSDPDPAAPIAKQTRFAGSDRQGRGRLVAALRSGPVPTARLADVMGWADDPQRARRVADTVVADGLAIVGARGTLRLP